MKTRELMPFDLDVCVQLLIDAYNPPPWNDHWTESSGKKYLSEFFSNHNFIGYVVVESEEVVGAMFAHRKTWWTNDEIFIDELFVRPDFQRKGCGKLLMDQAEALSKELGLGGVTLLTNRYLPARLFYEKNGYSVAEHVVFMYKVVD